VLQEEVLEVVLEESGNPSADAEDWKCYKRRYWKWYWKTSGNRLQLTLRTGSSTRGGTKSGTGRVRQSSPADAEDWKCYKRRYWKWYWKTSGNRLQLTLRTGSVTRGGTGSGTGRVRQSSPADAEDWKCYKRRYWKWYWKSQATVSS